MLDKDTISAEFKTLQDNICQALEAADGSGKFVEDQWQREGGGGGRSRVLQDGSVLEKGGVGFSAVYGNTPEALQQKMGFPQGEFFATGVSIVMHPHNPHVPIIHMNVRYFELSNGTFWFGGGIDLTPHYIVPEQAAYFHQQLKQVCDKHNPAYYPEFKAWADRYFYLPHRQETRGIGGIFFDRLKPEGRRDKTALHTFVMNVGRAFAPIYTHLIALNKDKPYTEAQKEWQLLRRGRYVEFNLVWDQGTKFGLETGGRTESILMSLPQHASWRYNHQVQADSPEAQTLAQLKQGIDWFSI